MTDSSSSISWLFDGAIPLPDLLTRAAAPETPASEAWLALRHLTRRTSGYALLSRAAKVADRLMAAGSGPQQPLRLALLGGYTTSQFAPLLRLFLAVEGIAAAIYDGPFGQFALELLGPSAELQAFQPQIALIAPGYRDTQVWQAAVPGPADVDADVTLFQQLWQRARDLGIQPVQQNVDLPDVTPLGNLDGITASGRVRRLRELNLRLADAAESQTVLIDVERLAGSVGTRQWSDDRWWFVAKHGVSQAALPILAKAQVNVIKGMLGRSAKVLVLDLDNTIWGGVIGEDGLAGIELNGSATGEAYVAFQRFCRDLRARGVLLAIVSKNNDEDARLPFREHPEMILKENDLAAFRANWLPKSENIRSIAEELDLSVESFVFFDDNPVERAEVQIALPEVHVVAVPEEPAYYVRAMADCGAFEIPRLTEEDRLRADDYLARRQATDLQQQSGSVDDYLKALDMVATMTPFAMADLPRIYQLVHKTNQFNLTTERHAEADLLRMMASPCHETLAVRLKDRFGDRGLVGLLAAEVNAETLQIETWLMSCRVLSRTLEATMLRWVVARAEARGLATLTGIYRPTAKNALVSDLYPRLGFQPAGTEADGTTRWQLDLRTAIDLPGTFIRWEGSTGSGCQASG